MTDQISAILSACVGPVALFIDFDGTLVDIAPSPDAIEVPPSLLDRLGALDGTLDGALALVTGRMVADIEGFLPESQIVIAGSHGAEHRHRGSGTSMSPAHSVSAMALGDLLTTRFESDERILVERKPTGVAVHFRAAPERSDEVRTTVHRVLDAIEGFEAIEGKMVIEARPSGTDKGKAIASLMDSEPFRSRTPMFIGDDVTDEDGFRTVNAMNGVSIKIGPGPSQARFRLPDVPSVYRFLDLLAERQATPISEVRP